MNKPKLTEIKTHKSCPPVPRSIMTASRCELSDLSLFVVEGKIPNDLQGHAFFIAPVGSVDSGGLPYPDGNSILNGDGMIFRLDFDRQGTVHVTSRLAKPPCYYADKATQVKTKYVKHRFQNYGISRFSLSLGLRNDLNTAFLPMKFGHKQERLLIAYDAGRPYEIDTVTLQTITPIGMNKEWKKAMPLNFPFRPILSTAHPVFDPITNEMFTVNYGRSIGSFLETLPLIEKGVKGFRLIQKNCKPVFVLFRDNLSQNLGKNTLNRFKKVFPFFAWVEEKIKTLEVKDFVDLICWDGVGQFERCKLVLSDRSPVKIKQTIHQIGITQDYVVLMDTGFKAGLGQVIDKPFTKFKSFGRFFRSLLTLPVLPDTTIYIVRRDELKKKKSVNFSQQDIEIVAQKIVIPMQTVHYLVDYGNPDGQITLHAAHFCAWDVAEWLRKYDRSAYPPHNFVASHLCGMLHNEADVGRMGRYVIDAETAQVLDSRVIYDKNCTWGAGLYAYQETLSSGMPPQKIDNIYWVTLGLWKELMTEFMWNLYDDYQYRAVPISELLRLAEQGIPSYLFRLETASMKIADRYELPAGCIILSPQFVPRGSDKESSTNGYIVCCVFTPECSEIWIFDAANLSKGPECKLRHPLFNFGFTIHTAWLPKIGRRTASYNIPVREDYDPIVKKKSREIQELFEQEVYPQFENPVNHS